MRRRGKTLRVTWTVVVATLAAPVAKAHAPAVLHADRPFVVEDSTISRALYGSFSSGAERFVVKLDFPEPFALPFEVLVPHRDGWRKHRPAYAVIARGLPAPSAEEAASLPAPLPEGHGAFVDLNRVDPRPVIYESFTRRFFWTSGPVALVVPPGPAEIWIWSPEGTKGQVVIGFGVEERIDIGEALADWGSFAY